MTAHPDHLSEIARLTRERDHEIELKLYAQHSQRNLQERAEKAEGALAEADALISTHQHAIDPNHPDAWPKDSALRRAVDRHAAREVARHIASTPQTDE